jgi:hypothetical protein
MYKIAVSKLARVMTCAGSLFFDLPRQESSPQAEEGTAAGEYLELLLTTAATNPPTHASNGHPFDEDMKFYANETAKEIKSKADTPVLCETRIDWDTKTGVTIMGRYDACFVSEGNLYIDDYKYGWSPVEAFENWQLLGYAIGEVIRRGKAFPQIIMRIHQPRPHHEEGPIREWIVTYEELLTYKAMIDNRMELITNGDNSLVTSRNCKYCPAAAEACPAFNKAFFRGIDVTHDFIQDNISDQELSFQMDLMNRINEVFKVKKDSIEQLVATRIKAGNLIPNYVTKDKMSDRKWKKDISPELIKMLSGKNVVETKMLSPAKAEKLGLDKKLVETMVERRFLGQTVKRIDTTKLGNNIFGKPS